MEKRASALAMCAQWPLMNGHVRLYAHTHIYIRDAKTCLKALIQSFEVYLFKLFYVTLESPNSTSYIILVFVFEVLSSNYFQRTSIEIKFKLAFIITIRVIIYHSFE